MDSEFSAAHSAHVNGNGQYFTVSDVARLLSVSPQSVRLYESQGAIPQSVRSLGGHRRFLRADLQTAGIIPPDTAADAARGQNEKTQEKSNIIYCRVSSEKQKSAGSLLTQEKNLLEFVNRNYDISAEEIDVYRECKSALNRRPQLLKILDRLVSDNPPVYWFVQMADRISRMGESEMSIWKHLCDRCGTKLVFCPETVDDADTEDKNQLIEELFSVITYFTAKNNGLRSRSRTIIKIPETHLNRMLELYRAGHRWNSIRTVLRNEGIRNEKERFYHHNHIAKILREHFKKNGVPENEVQKEINQSVRQFLKDETRKDKAGRIFSTCLWTAFHSWCEKNNYPYLTMNSFFSILKSDHDLAVKPSSYGANAVRCIKFKRKEWAGAHSNPYTKNKNHLADVSEIIRQSFDTGK